MRTGETTLPLFTTETPAAWLTTARRELWRSFPAWMFFLYACLLLNTELTNMVPARPDFASTVVFPLAVFTVFAVTRALRAPDVRRRWTMVAVTVGLAFGLPLLNLLVHRPSPLALSTLLAWYEWSNFAWAALLVWHAWKHEKSHVWLYFGVSFVYGACLENGGIVLGFFHEQNLTATIVRPFVAPVATMVGWSVVLLMASFVVRSLRAVTPWLRRSAMASALLVAVFATMLDLQIDPIATAAGCWVWHESLPGWWHGVPLVNFVAWTCALAPYAYVLYRVQDHHGLADDARWEKKHLLHALALVPAALALAAVCFVGATLVLEGPNGPSWELLNAFVARFVS